MTQSWHCQSGQSCFPHTLGNCFLSWVICYQKMSSQCCVLFICFIEKKDFSLWMQLILYAREHYLLWWLTHWDTILKLQVKDELYEQWQSVKPFREYFFSFCGDISNASHFVFSFDPTRRILWLSPKENSQRISAGRCPKVDASSPSFKADEILLLLPRDLRPCLYLHPGHRDKQKWEKKKNTRNSVFICSIDGVPKSMV